uniref:Uncharacterized protein n=1 Tax=Rhizophagus irregularis (strain DAOM 181602 / DAOM 197198 / MUCL 43194) TaxID=747089 RepID=U9TGK5_RHIID
MSICIGRAGRASSCRLNFLTIFFAFLNISEYVENFKHLVALNLHLTMKMTASDSREVHVFVNWTIKGWLKIEEKIRIETCIACGLEQNLKIWWEDFYEKKFRFLKRNLNATITVLDIAEISWGPSLNSMGR